jgi:hypothetical protein
LPEPVSVALIRNAITTPTMKISGEGHARAARDEMKYLTEELLAFARASGAETPVIDDLYPDFDPATSPLPDGSSEIGLQWRGVLVTAAITGAAAIVLPRIWASIAKGQSIAGTRCAIWSSK